MAHDKVYIYDEDNIRINVYEESPSEIHLINEDPSFEIIRIYEPGPQGPRGLDGTAQIPNLVVTSSEQINYYSVQNAPFYPIVSGSLFGSTSSFAFFGTFSSSLLPWSSSFDLGSLQNPWKNVYVSNSLFVGNSKITTSSFGFDDFVIKRLATDQTTLILKSGSISASFSESGIFIIPDFNYLPNITRGGLIVSGSDLLVGI